jgi:hypothetical protein
MKMNTAAVARGALGTFARQHDSRRLSASPARMSAMDFVSSDTKMQVLARAGLFALSIRLTISALSSARD